MGHTCSRHNGGQGSSVDALNFNNNERQGSPCQHTHGNTEQRPQESTNVHESSGAERLVENCGSPSGERESSEESVDGNEERSTSSDDHSLRDDQQHTEDATDSESETQQILGDPVNILSTLQQLAGTISRSQLFQVFAEDNRINKDEHHCRLQLADVNLMDISNEGTRVWKGNGDLVPYDRHFAERQRERLWGVCASCKEEGYDKRRCTRCQMAKYCNTECQRKDFERHKDICYRLSRFHTARSKLKPELKETLFGQLGYLHISYFLGSIPERARYAMTGPRICVLVEVVGILRENNPHNANPFIFGVRVRDITNHTTDVLFNLLAINPLLLLGGAWETKLLMALFFRPGDFLLLIDARWDVFGLKCGDIYINRSDQAEVIVMD